MLKQRIKSMMAGGAGWPLSAPLRRSAVVVLMYHRITRSDDAFGGSDVDQFREQMRWLKQRCRLIAPEEYLDAVKRPSRLRPAVLVTFDDGYRDYHDNAYPVLHDLKIPAVVFVATSFLGSNRLIWTDAVSWAFFRSPRKVLRLPWATGVSLELGDGQERERAARMVKDFLKDRPDAERLRLQESLFEDLGVDPEDGSAGRQMLTWEEARATLEYTRYGGHTHTHPILSQITPEEADKEIRLCRERVQSEIGIAPRFFAYPNGRAQDFTEQTKASLVRHGFELGFATIEGVNDAQSDRYAIRRQPTGARNLADFAWLVAGH